MTTAGNPGGPLPLSAGQEALWLAYRSQPSSPVYNVAVAVRVHTPLDASALAKAVTATADRHELLRSLFAEIDGQPRRVVREATRARLEAHDLTAASDSQVRAAAQAELARPFRLSTEHPFRVILLRVAPDDTVLLITAHHIATDADSQVLVLRDILDAYQAFRRDNGPPAWPRLAATYAEHVAAERELLASPRVAALTEYWRTSCAGAGPTLALPTDHARPEVQRFTGSQYQFSLSGGLAPKLQAAARAMGVTMFTYLLGIFQALLYRYTLQSDFLIGYVTTTRQRKTRDVVGYFINTLPVRAHINQGSTLREIVMAASRNVRAGMAHRDLPLPEIVRALRLPRDPGRLSMFQVLFTMLAAYPPDPLFDLTTVGGDLMYGELQLSDFDVRQQEGQFDLTMELIEAGPVINGIIKYDTDLFSSKTIEDYVRHFVLLLKAAAADAGQRATDVSLADSREREWLLECSSGS